MFAPLADRLLTFLADWDTTAFLLLNGLHSPLLDAVMREVSSPWVLVPIHLLVLAVLFRRRTWSARGTLLAVLLLVVAVDLAGAHLIKNLAQRPRPSHETALADVIHLLGGRRSGTYGFASTHTSYAFALAAFTWLLLSQHRLTLLVFAWAALVGYSRIYIGLHYPGDVLAGACWGMTAAAAVWWVAVRLGRRPLASLARTAPHRVEHDRGALRPAA